MWAAGAAKSTTAAVAAGVAAGLCMAEGRGIGGVGAAAVALRSSRPAVPHAWMTAVVHESARPPSGWATLSSPAPPATTTRHKQDGGGNHRSTRHGGFRI